MNQPIQENKKKCTGAHCRCMNLGGTCPNMHPVECEEHCPELVAEWKKKQSAPQNTSREEIRERWRKYAASEVEVSPTKLLTWWLAEIEAAEKQTELECDDFFRKRKDGWDAIAFQAGYDKGVIDGKDGMDDVNEAAYAAGQETERERVRGIVKKLKQTDETQLSEDHIYDEALDDLLSAIEPKS